MKETTNQICSSVKTFVYAGLPEPIGAPPSAVDPYK
jgi:hypothetical protein